MEVAEDEREHNVGWLYTDLEASGLDVGALICKCGHLGEDHHAVYWSLGMTMDECEFYGSNETGGMKPTWRSTLFGWKPLRSKWRKPPPGPRISVPWHAGLLRRMVRFIIRGPFWLDHCHHFEQKGA